MSLDEVENSKSVWFCEKCRMRLLDLLLYCDILCGVCAINSCLRAQFATHEAFSACQEIDLSIFCYVPDGRLSSLCLFVLVFGGPLSMVHP